MSETERARELLARSERTLEESRNRPRVRSSWPEPSESTVTVPVHKVREPVRSRSMDAETQAKWDAWACTIARNEALKIQTQHIERVGKPLLQIIDALGERTEKLERELQAIKQRQPETAQEWPLRAINGGKQ